ncbi:MAG: ribokinase [Planctomycetes bacterium RBG_16_64_12]|nr:MAG: ribokinase [Planctomycetes bacterium RBG_16_64_12]
MKEPRIVVVGSSNTDMVVKAKRIPVPGETVTGGEFVMAAGGKGANQAVAAARLGAQVTFVARLGRDMFGDQAVENYEKEGIVTDFVLRDSENHTGVALIMVDEQGENLIAVASGANHALTPEDVAQAAEQIRSADVVMLQLEIPMGTVEFTAQLAADAGVRVILDPAPAAPLGDALVRRVTYLTPNESEAQRLTGIQVRDETSARAAAEKLLKSGARYVVVTLGAKGALVAGPQKAILIPGYAVEARDSTAAGDAFNGGLAAALAKGLPLDEAVREANLAGALSVTRMGAQPSLPTAEELRRFAKEVRGR